MIECAGVQVEYGTGTLAVQAVRDLSFRVAQGEIFGLVGESGSGKSTVLKAICGLTPLRKGTILLNREQLQKKRDKAFYRQVQMVFQDPYSSLHPRHTVDTILREPIIIHRLPDADQRIVQALEDVGLAPHFRFRYSHQLSGGQRQRVAIARALILHPEVLLLDEPTSALDVSVQAEILNLLVTLQRRYGFTSILVSHDLAVVHFFCDQVGVMLKGKLVEQCSTDALAQGRVLHRYTRQLLTASKGYDRQVVDSFQVFS